MPSEAYMACSRLLLCPILHTKFDRTRHVATSHLPVKVAPTSQGRIHQPRSHPPAKVESTNQGRIHQSGSHPPVKVSPTSQGSAHQSRPQPMVKVAPTSPSRTHQSRSICNVACTVAVHRQGQPALPCTVQTGTCHMEHRYTALWKKGLYQCWQPAMEDRQPTWRLGRPIED